MARESIKLGRLVDAKLEQWERESVHNIKCWYARGTVKTAEVVTFPTGSKKFVVIANDDFKLDCSMAGYAEIQRFLQAGS